jgi:TetR/AcrR family transcriptional repressor of nem operon
MMYVMSTQEVNGKVAREGRQLRNSLTDLSIIANIRREDLGKSMRYDDNHKERTRARVLAEAAAAIKSKGVERVGVAEVMAGAGLTHGGFYAHFKSKDDLLTEAVSFMFDASYAWFLRHTEGRAPADALSNYIDAYLATSQRDDRAHGCPIAALSGDLPNMPELARARFADGTERLVAALAKLVKKLGAKNAKALAWSAMAEMAGALALSRTVSDADTSTQILRNSRATVRSRIGLDRSTSRGV